MNVHILAVGSELLTPFFRDTNSLYLTERLNDLGLDVAFKGLVGDERPSLIWAFRQSLAAADLVILTGGLGPTDDDRTREAVAETLNRELVFREDILRNIEERFRGRGKAMPSTNRKQALIVAGAEVLNNAHGTAPGLWISAEEKAIVLLPGPPQEMRGMFETSVWPRLALGRTGKMARIVFKTTGLTESEIEVRIAGLYPKGEGRRLTILASPGQIELHIAVYTETDGRDVSREAAELADSLRSRLGLHVFSEDGAELEEVVGRLLREKGKTLAAAESCTGGLIGHRITSVAGSSSYFLEGFVTYGNRAKTGRLGVSEDLLAAHGAVSPEVALAMAEGARRTAGADYGLGVTGIAGPDGGTPDKPVGLVYTALAWEGGREVEKNLFLGPRDRVKFQSSQNILDLLRRRLLQEEKR